MNNILIHHARSVVLAACAVLVGLTAQAMLAIDGYVMANEIRIHYWRTGGDRPVLLMADGSSDDGLCWTNLAKELVQDDVKKQNEAVAGLLKHGTIVHVAGAKHNVRRDQKECLLESLQAFLADL